MSRESGTARVADMLRSNPVFAAADAERLAALATRCSVLEIPAGHILFKTGEPARAVYVLVQGIIRVYQCAEDNREVTVTNLLAPNTFAEMEVIAESVGQPRLGYLEHTQAVRAATLVEIPAADFLAFIEEDPGSTRELLKDVCSRFCLNARREIDVMLEVPVRLAALMMAYVELAGQPTDDGGVLIKLPLTHEDLANGLGVAVKSIARTLKEWQTQGWVSRHKGWFVLHKPDAIEALCGAARFKLNYSYNPVDTKPKS